VFCPSSGEVLVEWKDRPLSSDVAVRIPVSWTHSFPSTFQYKLPNIVYRAVYVMKNDRLIRAVFSNFSETRLAVVSAIFPLDWL
jgi:hypothetical protein